MVRAVVDPECYLRNTYHVLEEGDVIWDVKLYRSKSQNGRALKQDIQADVDKRRNGFYNMQLLKHNETDTNEYFIYTRWGHVGYGGRPTSTPYGANLVGAKTWFTDKFREKTKNKWENRNNFKYHAGNFSLMRVNYEEVANIENQFDQMAINANSSFSTANAEIQELFNRICNFEEMKKTVEQLDFFCAPLSPFATLDLSEGFRLLSQLQQFVDSEDVESDEFKEIANEYYTKIPHKTPFRKLPLLVDTGKAIRQELELLELLEDIQFAYQSLQGEHAVNKRRSFVNEYFEKMKCSITLLANTSDEYKMVKKYISRTHMHTATIGNVFQIEREGEADKFRKDIGKRMLLWHGSRVANYYSILSQGLRVPHDNAPDSGYSFGKGIYFADMALKSWEYCNSTKTGQKDLLLLCEVALGESKLLHNRINNAPVLSMEEKSVKGVGRTFPNEDTYDTLSNGTVVPCGIIKKNVAIQTTLEYNEYIVYQSDQVQIRYLVEVIYKI